MNWKETNKSYPFLILVLWTATSCMARVSDVYLNYPEPKAGEEVCSIKTSPEDRSVRTDVTSVQNGEFYSVDAHLMRTSKLVRFGETVPRYFNDSDPDAWTSEGYVYLYHVYEVRLTPGRHQIVVTFPYESDSSFPHRLQDRIILQNVNCKAGESRRLFYSRDKVPDKDGLRRYWLEGEQGVIWEGWKHRTQREATFDLSGVN